MLYGAGGDDVVRVGESRVEGGRVSALFEANGRTVARAELLFTRDGGVKPWPERNWDALAVEGFDPASGAVSVALPDGAQSWVVNLVTDDGLVFSTPYSGA